MAVIGAQFGIADESTWGTYVAPTRFYEFESENIQPRVTPVESFAVGRGVYARADRRHHVVTGAGGAVTLPFMTKGMGLLMKHIFGSHSATQQGATSEYLHLSQPDANGKSGLKLTAQVGRPDIGGTVRPFSWTGGKVIGAEFVCQKDGKLTVTPTFDFETETTSESLASASYQTGDDFFDFAMASATIGGSAVHLESFRLIIAHPMAVDRYGLGNTKKEQKANAEWTVIAGLDFEFEDLTRHGAYKAATEAQNLIVTFDTGVAVPTGDGGNFSAVFTIPLMVPIQGGVNVGGPDRIMEPYQYKALYDGSNPVVKLEQTNADTAA